MNIVTLVAEFVAVWLVLWLASFALVYVLLTVIVDPICAWRERRQEVARLRADTARALARIDRQTDAAIVHLHAAYGQALAQIRHDARSFRR